MFASALIVTVVASSVLGFSAPADNTVEDTIYPNAVRQGLSYSHGAVSDDTLRSVGHMICSDLDSGTSKLQVARSMMSGFNRESPSDPLTPGEAGYMIGASTAAYCPTHVDEPIS